MNRCSADALSVQQEGCICFGNEGGNTHAHLKNIRQQNKKMQQKKNNNN